MEYCVTPAFENLLGKARLASANSHSGSVYGLDEDYCIAYLNPAWYRFAEENGSNLFLGERWALGRNIFECIPEVLHDRYKKLYDAARVVDLEELTPPRCEYECSSPTEFRKFSMHFHPLGELSVLVVNSIVIEAPHNDRAAPVQTLHDESDYRNTHGIIRQCANCRRVQNLRQGQRWDWVPKWVKNPASSISHGICETCASHYYFSEVQ